VKKLAIACCACLALGTAPAPLMRKLVDFLPIGWNTATEPFRIIGNVYYVGTRGLASYLVVTPNGHILIDTVMPESTALIEANVAKLDFAVADIKYLLNTHAHVDHAGGFAQLKAKTGAQLVAGAADEPFLEGGYYPGREKCALLAFPPVKVDRAVTEETWCRSATSSSPRGRPQPFARLHQLGDDGRRQRARARRALLL
jgi:metallo-beta-lactamase class B